MRNRFLLGAIVGTLAFVLCQHFLARWWAPALINASFVNPSPHKWSPALGALGDALFGISFVLPGVCAGFISGRRGFLVGALVGVVGSFLCGALYELLQAHSGAVRFKWTAVFNL